MSAHKTKITVFFPYICVSTVNRRYITYTIIIYRVYHYKHAHYISFNNSVIQNFELEFLNILEDHIFKYLIVGTYSF